MTETILEQTMAEMNKTIKVYEKEIHEVTQNLGTALRYPRYTDLPGDFPKATDADGVCIEPHTASSISMEAAVKITAMAAEITDLEMNSVERSELEAAQSKQLSIFDMEYPPRIHQGPPIHEVLDLLTAEDVNRWIIQIQGLNEQVIHQQAQIARTQLDRDSQYARAASMEENFNEMCSRFKHEQAILNQQLMRRERITRRALRLIAGSAQEPISDADRTHAGVLLSSMEPQPTIDRGVDVVGQMTGVHPGYMQANTTGPENYMRQDRPVPTQEIAPGWHRRI